MGQQMMHGDGALVVGYRADELAHRIAHAQPPHHLQLQDRRGGELLGHRHDVVGGVAPGGDLRLSIGEAEAPAVRDLTVAGGDYGAAGPVGQGVVEELHYRRINTPRLRGGRGRVLAAVPARGESEHGHEKHDEGTRSRDRVGPTHLPPFYNGTQIAPPLQTLSTNYREIRKSEVQLRRIHLLRTRVNKAKRKAGVSRNPALGPPNCRALGSSLPSFLVTCLPRGFGRRSLAYPAHYVQDHHVANCQARESGR